jgi:hypothetical protein
MGVETLPTLALPEIASVRKRRPASVSENARAILARVPELGSDDGHVEMFKNKKGGP